MSRFWVWVLTVMSGIVSVALTVWLCVIIATAVTAWIVRTF